MRKTNLALALFVCAAFGLATVANAETKRVTKPSDEQQRRTSSSRKSTQNDRRTTATRGTTTSKRSSAVTRQRSGSVRHATSSRHTRSQAVTRTTKSTGGSRVIVQDRRRYTTRRPTPSGSIRHVYRPQPRNTTVVIKGRRAPRIGSIVHYGRRVRVLPPRYRTVVIDRRDYYVDGPSVYIRLGTPAAPEYVVTRPPIGFRLSVLPVGVDLVVYGGRNYYYYDDVYYSEYWEGDDPYYEVVETPFGADIVNLPPEHEIVYVKQRRYYRIGRYYYQPVIRSNRTVYTRVKIDFD